MRVHGTEAVDAIARDSIEAQWDKRVPELLQIRTDGWTDEQRERFRTVLKIPRA